MRPRDRLTKQQTGPSLRAASSAPRLGSLSVRIWFSVRQRAGTGSCCRPNRLSARARVRCRTARTSCRYFGCALRSVLIVRACEWLFLCRSVTVFAVVVTAAEGNLSTFRTSDVSIISARSQWQPGWASGELNRRVRPEASRRTVRSSALLNTSCLPDEAAPRPHADEATFVSSLDRVTKSLRLKLGPVDSLACLRSSRCTSPAQALPMLQLHSPSR